MRIKDVKNKLIAKSFDSEYPHGILCCERVNVFFDSLVYYFIYSDNNDKIRKIKILKSSFLFSLCEYNKYKMSCNSDLIFITLSSYEPVDDISFVINKATNEKFYLGENVNLTDSPLLDINHEWKV